MNEKIIAYLEEHGKVNINELAAGLDMAGAEKFPKLIKEISKLESQGKLRFDDYGNLALRKKIEKKKEITVTGVFRANKAGFGFLAVDENEDDMFVGRNDVGHAVDGDTVEAVVKKPANRLKGTAAEVRIVGIVERSLKTVVGKFILDDEKPKYAGYIKSKNQKIQQKIYIKKEPVLLDGTEIIKVDIDKYPTRGYDYFVGHVRDIVGHQGDVGIDVLEVLESMDIKSEFPEDVMAEANAVSDAPSEKDMVGRVDLRNEITFTIDGADAKDLDDAVHIKLLSNGNFELGVHIADVSYYVTEGSALNREAVARGTSVYVTDRVVPMLPERLSNGICSLNPNVDRLTQSCLMEIDRNGHVVNHQICQSVIKTTFRMTYSNVNDIIAGDEELIEQYQPIVDSIHHMTALHNILETMRMRRGALNFDTSEAKIIVNDCAQYNGCHCTVSGLCIDCIGIHSTDTAGRNRNSNGRGRCSRLFHGRGGFCSCGSNFRFHRCNFINGHFHTASGNVSTLVIVEHIDVGVNDQRINGSRRIREGKLYGICTVLIQLHFFRRRFCIIPSGISAHCTV